MSDTELLNLAKNVQKFLEDGREINPEALKILIRDYIAMKEAMIAREQYPI